MLQGLHILPFLTQPNNEIVSLTSRDRLRLAGGQAFESDHVGEVRHVPSGDRLAEEHRPDVDLPEQFHFAFYDLILPTWEWYPRQLYALATGTVVLASLIGLARRSRWGEAGDGGWRTPGRYLAFAAGGLAATWLGFATYLPTMFALSTIRTHVLAMAGEAVLLASLIWLAGSLVRQGSRRRAVWALGMAYIG